LLGADGPFLVVITFASFYRGEDTNPKETGLESPQQRRQPKNAIELRRWMHSMTLLSPMYGTHGRYRATSGTGAP
jgi:hypothetical protein